MNYFMKICNSIRFGLPDISSELEEQNELKKKEMEIQREQKKRDEYLTFLRRLGNKELLELYDNEEETYMVTPTISGGLGNQMFMRFPQEAIVNEKYQDIKNECLVRGLI